MLPVTTRKARLASLQGISGSFASDDLLRDVKDVADDTLLNANRYRYADFFYRVKDLVRRHWRPDQVYRARDPTGRLYGTKDRYTVLDVTLDAEGRVTGLRTDSRSGLDFMDEEARGAFLRAEVFPNPPEGLIRDGSIKFRFGFFFEIGTGKQRFGWRRL
ncbi:MAG: TonB family protein [Myxococcota bacterium]|nr:TonB family protein [Myxococcota bacterium]